MIKTLFTLFWACMALTFLPAFAQADLNKSAGNYQSHSSEPGGLSIKTDNGIQFRATAYSPNIIRIRFSDGKPWDDFSFSVISNPLPCKTELKEEAGKLTLSTDSLRLEISKSPVRIRLFDLKGRLVNEDESAFGTSYLGTQVTTYKHLQPNERFIGLGEKTGSLDRKGDYYTNWNTDYFGYPANGDPLYQSLPFYIGVHSNLVYGLFLDNSFKSTFAFGAGNDRFAAFSADDGEMNYYLIHHSTVPKILESYTWLTGRMALPPMWALGLQQSRYTYYPQKRVQDVAELYRDKGIPVDAIVLDIHYMDKYKIFSWDAARFPEPKKMTANLKKMGMHLVVIHDPGIKVEKGYKPYDDGIAAGIFAKYPDGTNYAAKVWPGLCNFPDFTSAKARNWWGEQMKVNADDGIDGFWNDMNEPAVWGKWIPDLVQFDFEGKKGTHRRAHNIYGFQMARASYEGGRKVLGKRPFVLTRAGFCGVQRYAAVWTGDNVASDDHMMSGVRLINSMGLSGLSFTGMDVGGFTGGASRELYTRWVSIGAFSPFFRIHYRLNTKDAEPWSFGEKSEAINKNYISLRYRLMPYLYSSFYECSQNGMPINRSLSVNYPHNAKVYEGKYQNQFFFGPGILVAPLESNKELARVYLPDDNTWYDMYDDRTWKGNEELITEAPLEKLPLFVRGGSIIPMQHLVMNTSEIPKDTLLLHLYNGKTGSTFVYYEDEGSNFDNEKGIYCRRNITLNPSKRSLTLTAAEGGFKSRYNHVKFIFHGFTELKNEVKADNQKLALKSERYSLVADMPNFDPEGTVSKAAPAAAARTAVMPLGTAAISVSW